MNQESLFKNFTDLISHATEVAASIIIGISVGISFYYYFRNFFSKAKKLPKEDIRLDLGKSLALGLEFLLGADILKTVVAPSWQAIGMLAAIAVLRTGLNFFLGKELRDSHRKSDIS